MFLRNKLSLDKPVEKVIASVTAASTETTQQYVYQFYVNGQLVGLGPSVKIFLTYIIILMILLRF